LAIVNLIYFWCNYTKEKLPVSVENGDSRIEFLTSIMNLTLLFAKASPSDFDINSKAATAYIVIAASVTSDFSSKNIIRFRNGHNETANSGIDMPLLLHYSRRITKVPYPMVRSWPSDTMNERCRPSKRDTVDVNPPLAYPLAG
jgi:hypothetical protein